MFFKEIINFIFVIWFLNFWFVFIISSIGSMEIKEIRMMVVDIEYSWKI